MSAVIVLTATIKAIVTFAPGHLDSIELIPGPSNAAQVPISAMSPLPSAKRCSTRTAAARSRRSATHDAAPGYRHLDRMSAKADGTDSRLLMIVDIIKLCHCLPFPMLRVRRLGDLLGQSVAGSRYRPCHPSAAQRRRRSLPPLQRRCFVLE